MSSFFIPFIGNSTGGGGTTDAYTKTETNTLLAGKADIVNGKVPASQLPSYVDDVLEYDSASSFPGGGESGKIYVAADTNKTYRWGGSAYVEISESLALGETASTAYPGNKGKANADAIAKKPGEITTGKQYTIDGQTVTAGVGAETFNNLANNMAAGQYSHAEGNITTASGARSHAEGNGSIASGIDSHAEGNWTIASGGASHAEGSTAIASGDQSHAEGTQTTASGYDSHAEGTGTTASGDSSHAEGNTTIASGAQSHAEGCNTTASGGFSHAEGSNTKASSAYQHVQGRYNIEDADNTYAFIIGNGTADNARHNAFAIDWNGLIYINSANAGIDLTKKPGEITTGKQYTIDGQTVTAGEGAEVFNDLSGNIASGAGSHAEGISTKAVGNYSHAEGAATKSSGNQSHSEGSLTKASGNQSHAEGTNTEASSEQSHAEGARTTASGNQSHAEGTGTTASGNQSHAEGTSTTASGDFSHSEGGGARATGPGSHAEGQGTVASGSSAHSEGSGTTASGQSSHAEGIGTIASGIGSHAEGSGTKASSANQHVQGKYNVEDANNIYAFIIGNGTNDGTRHNAFTIDWNGLIYVNGAATGVDVSALAPQATTYTKTEVNTLLADKADLSIFTPMTQAEYDALVTKTAPLYFIYEDGDGA